MHLQGILFDVDGTLVDSNDLHADCWVEAFAHFGKRVEWDVVRTQIGKGGDLLVPDLCNAREMQRFGEALKAFRSELYKSKYMARVKPFPRVRELFAELRRRGIHLALASSANRDEVEYTTQLLGVGELLEGSTSKHDAKLSKPSPEIFRAALDQIGTAAGTTMTVGDTPLRRSRLAPRGAADRGGALGRIRARRVGEGGVDVRRRRATRGRDRHHR